MADTPVKTEQYRELAGYGLTFVQSERPWRYPWHTHTFYSELMLVTHGQVVQTLNDRRVVSKAGDLLLIRPKDVHDISGQGIAYYNLMFSDDKLEQIEKICGQTGIRTRLLNPKMPPTVSLRGEELDRVARGFNDALLATDPTQRLVSLPRIFFEIILDHFVFPFTDRPQANTMPAWLIQTIRQVELNPDKTVSVPDIVAMSGVSPEHVSRTFRKFLGMTPSTYIAKQRLQQACRLLSGTNRKLLDICYQVGFDNLSYFCNLFRREYGMSPGRYRNQYSILQRRPDTPPEP